MTAAGYKNMDVFIAGQTPFSFATFLLGEQKKSRFNKQKSLKRSIEVVDLIYQHTIINKPRLDKLEFLEVLLFRI